MIVPILLGLLGGTGIVCFFLALIYGEDIKKWYKKRKAFSEVTDLQTMRRAHKEQQILNAIKAAEELKKTILDAHESLRNSGKANVTSYNRKTADWFKERGYTVTETRSDFTIEIPPMSDKEYSDLILGDKK